MPKESIAVGLERLPAKCLENNHQPSPIERFTTVISEVAPWRTVKFSGTPNFYVKSEPKNKRRKTASSYIRAHMSPQIKTAFSVSSTTHTAEAKSITALPEKKGMQDKEENGSETLKLA